jgi:hypothetical protein
MKSIWKISLLAFIALTFFSCSSDDKTNIEIPSNSWEVREMESSNEGGGNDATDLWNDSFRQ